MENALALVISMSTGQHDLMSIERPAISVGEVPGLTDEQRNGYVLVLVDMLRTRREICSVCGVE